ncbi:putative nucleotidyltransferase with HDIG domain [Bradyrhizobium sp. LM4.3]
MPVNEVDCANRGYTELHSSISLTDANPALSQTSCARRCWRIFRNSRKFVMRNCATIEAWAYALAEADFPRVTAIPGEATPGDFALKRGSQAIHLRSVPRIAIAIADEFAREFPETMVDRDIVLAGALLHDVGKAWEFDRANRKRWEADKSQAGSPSLRHPVYGAHICIAVGLPEEIAHCARPFLREAT